MESSEKAAEVRVFVKSDHDHDADGGLEGDHVEDTEGEHHAASH